jgi:hypothetical protein
MIAAPFREETILRAGHAFQQATDHHLRRPPLSPPGGEDKGEGGTSLPAETKE